MTASRALLPRAVWLLIGGFALATTAWLFWRDPLADLPAPAERAVSTDGANPPAPTPRPEPRDHTGYVGSAACRACHAAICDTYAAHPMWSATSLAGAGPGQEAYGPDHGFEHAGENYFAERSSTGVVHHIVRRDAGGTPLYDDSAAVAYTVGSGDRGHSYLIQRGALLFQSPLSWYTGQQRWDLSPGYRGFNRRFERRIVDGCVTCHVGRMDFKPAQADCFGNPAVLEPGIGCERCHGPGREHIAWHESQPRPSSADPIVNPKDLEFAAREAVCLQCHFTGFDRVVRSGKSEYDFRPGDRLTDVWLTFVRDSQAAGAAVSHVEQLQSSQCYIQSQSQLGCTSCHDPHRSPSPDERVAFYRERCLTCHADADRGCELPVAQRLERSSADSCIDCHMPSRSADDVPHTALTDHRLRRNPALTTSDSVGTGRIVLSAEAQSVVPRWEQQRAEGILLSRRASQTSAPLLAEQSLALLRPLADEHRDDWPLQSAWASALMLTGDAAAARHTWEAILAADPLHESALEGLAYACHDAEQFELALQFFDRLIAVNPYRSDYHGRRAHVLGRLRRIEESVAAANRAIELNPSNPHLYRWLAEAHRVLGDDERSQEYSRLASELTPADNPSED
jgi:predicted CXXCH cytochrome family protein